MALGDITLTNYGTHNISGASLKTIVETINLGSKDASGSQLFIIPAEFGQVQVIKTSVAGW
jgi:hypothetical protein